MTDLRGAVELTFLLPGRHAARVRRQAAELLCRYLGGDIALVDEICAPRAFQEQLAVRAQEDSRRLFGEAVEASSSSTNTQLANVFVAMNQSLSNQEQTLSARGQLLARQKDNMLLARQNLEPMFEVWRGGASLQPRWAGSSLC